MVVNTWEKKFRTANRTSFNLELFFINILLLAKILLIVNDLLFEKQSDKNKGRGGDREGEGQGKRQGGKKGRKQIQRDKESSICCLAPQPGLCHVDTNS